MFEFKYDGLEISIFASKHAQERMEERGILPAPMYGAIVAAADKILDLKSGEDFAIVDKDINTAIVCIVESRMDIAISVITVIDTTNVWVKAGTKVINLWEI